MTAATTSQATEHVDVLIVGAGISGIGTACHLKASHPQRSYAILEARDAIGGTWDLFKYPGLRSDSDLQTFGFAFKPWTEPEAISEASKILAYVRETSSEYSVDEHIRFHHRVERAEWSSEQARWIVYARRTDSGDEVVLSASWLFGATGYYRYDEGFTPEFPGIEDFQGPVIHPQHWPEDLDYTGKRVVVIGSGATAVTLVPAMAPATAHTTMLQRSPTYIIPIPAKDPIANALQRVLGCERGYQLARRKNILLQRLTYNLARRRPRLVRALIRAIAKRQLPAGYDVDRHFHPAYDPWDQRLCVVPDGDLFAAISNGSASVVTDRIARFVSDGIELESGEKLDADIVVTATGLNLLAFGGIEMTVDGRPVDLPEHVAYRGVMLSDVPNFSYIVGYINASWTLKVDVAADYVCRLFTHMDARGYDRAVPVIGDRQVERLPLLDFSAGYVQRAMAAFPRQGAVRPWRNSMSYAADVVALRQEALEDGILQFSAAPDPRAAGLAGGDAVGELAAA